MTFLDTYDGRRYSLRDLYTDWKSFRQEDPKNHAETFRAELLEIILAAVNGRNDLDIISHTPGEIDRIVSVLRRSIK